MIELQIETLPSPLFAYGGLARGDLASMKHAHHPSAPKLALFQHLEKCQRLHELGISVALFPPHPRPLFSVLKKIGFEKAEQTPLRWLAACSSSSFHWTANSASVTPSKESLDGKLHISIANLSNRFHRSLEPNHTKELLDLLFQNVKNTVIHSPLPAGLLFGDEGSANQMRIEGGHTLFIYNEQPSHFPGRQTLEASEAIARRHQIPSEKTHFLRQNPLATDSGVFHNDLIAMASGPLLISHSAAFLDPLPSLPNLQHIQLTEIDFPLKHLVTSYLLNSQLVRRKDQTLVWVAPALCEHHTPSRTLLGKLPIDTLLFVDLSESLKGGGGAACQRLSCPLTEEEFKGLNHEFLYTETLHQELVEWGRRFYPEKLQIEKLRDQTVIQNAYEALEALSEYLPIPDSFLY